MILFGRNTYYVVRRIFVSKLSFAIQFRWLLVNVTWINSDAEGHRTIRSVTYTAVLYHFCFLCWENKHTLEFSILGLYVTRGHVPLRTDTLVMWLPSGCLHCTPVITKGDQIREDKVRFSKGGRGDSVGVATVISSR